MKNYLFCSERLGFRNWEKSDIDALAALNADAEVMEFFPSTKTKAETAAFIVRMQEHFVQYKHTFFAVETLEKGDFIGFIGFIYQTKFKAAFTPCAEIGWRLKRAAWGKGYATEGAKRCLVYAFEVCGYTEMYSFTAKINPRSERVMQKIGMAKVGEFEHPLLDVDDDLRMHILYKIEKYVE